MSHEGVLSTPGPGCNPPESQSDALNKGLVVPLETCYLAAELDFGW